MDPHSSSAYLSQIEKLLTEDGSFFSINRKETISGKGGIGYTMTGINSIVEKSGLMKKTKEIELLKSYSQSNDNLYPEENVEIAIYNKKSSL